MTCAPLAFAREAATAERGCSARLQQHRSLAGAIAQSAAALPREQHGCPLCGREAGPIDLRRRNRIMVMTRFHVKKDERALLLRKGDFVKVLSSGEYVYFDPLKRLAIEKFSLAKTLFDHKLADFLLKAEPEVVAREFVAVELGTTQIALRYENGVLVEVLAPNTRRLYWKGYIDVNFEKVDIATEFAITPTLVPKISALILRGGVKVAGNEGVFVALVPEHSVGLLYADGRLQLGLLAPGLHYFWRYLRDVKVETVDLRLQVLDVAGQEILTRDKVSLRVNLTAGYRFTDVRTAFAKQAKPVEFLYKELQFGLRAAVGTRSLDELLENKTTIDELIAEHIKRRVSGYGLEVASVGVKDIILPGEMKTILAKVVEAEKAAQANVIRRREETAATRSLLNTAKVMEDNPVALRLKELETLEKVTEKIDKISVFGGLEGVLKDLVKIRP
jgi:regulator of protease activity HflC (stomatin/prohibitin superfamily)